MTKNTRFKSFAKTLMAVAFVASPTVGTMAQANMKLPPEVLAKRAEAKKALKKKSGTPKREAKAAGVQLYGYVLYSDDHTPGLYTFNTSNPDGIKLVSSAVESYSSGTYAQGTFWSTYYSESDDNSKITMPIRLYGYNTADFTQEPVEKRGYTFTSISADLAFDPETQALYGIFSNADYNGFTTIGKMKYWQTEADGHVFDLYDCDPIGETPERMVAITFNRDGQMYTIGKSGKLYSVDKYSGEAKEIGSTGCNIYTWFQSATCDYSTGKIYWAAFDSDNFCTQIMEVDPQTAICKMISNFGFDDNSYTGAATYDQITGLYLKQDLTLNTPPQSVSDLKVNLTSMTSGTVSFTMPTKDVKDADITANMKYVVRINGVAVANGTAAPGEAVTANITANKSGNNVFSATAEIAATADSPAAVSEQSKMTVWVGYDIPKDPADVKATVNNSDVTISWTAPTEGANGGFFDKENLTYTVKRVMNGNEEEAVVLTDNCKETTFTDHIDNPEKATYYYMVAANNGDMKSNFVKSQEFSAGISVALPYKNSLNSSDKFDEMTVVNANNDDKTWYFDTYYNMTAYTCSSVNDADDWLIAPAFNAKKGSAYKFSFDAVNSYPDELVAASIGNAPTAEAMTTQVVEPTTITYNPRRHTLSGTYRATEDGLRYFGIHAVSEKDRSTLYAANLNISEIPSTAPDAATDLKVVPGENGATTADITFKAPTTTLGGEPLTDKMNIIIYRNGTSVTTLTGIEPGQEASYNDPEVPNGMCIYAVKAKNSNNEEGLDATAKVFVGPDAPGAVRNLRAYEDADKEGLIHVEWDAPEGANGGYVNPEDITYFISAGMSTEDINLGNANHYEDQLTINGKQAYNGYTVYASTSAGTGGKKTVVAIGGPAIEAPMIESFKSTTMKSGPWITTVTKGEIGEAWCYAMSESTITKPQDNDGGLQSFSAEKAGKAVRSESPKVDISKMQKPVLNFWAYMNGKGEKMRVSVQKDYKEFVDALDITSDQYTKGWNRFSIDLTPYKDSKYVRIGFEGEAVKDLDFFLAYDNVAIVEDVDNDLMAMSAAAPEKVKANETAPVTFSFRNNSANKVNAADYNIVLFKNGKEVVRTSGEDIDADMIKEVTLNDKTTVFDPEETEYYAAIDFASDKIADNNTSDKNIVKIEMPDYPAPTALKAVSGKNGVDLGWMAPDMENRNLQTTTESFDTYEAFDIEGFGDWTTYDGDKQNTIQLTLDASFGPLNYKNAGKPMAFQVFNVEKAGIPFASWDPHTGDQMLVSFACASSDGGFTKKQNDDWIISPELNGEAQNIKFFAKAGSASATPEMMEVLYSTTDKSIESFQKIDETIEVYNAASWDEYNFELPEGAKYFAIRCVSDNKLALLIDDITYTAAGAKPEEIALQGYNVYRNRVKMNEEPVSVEAYTDLTAQDNEKYSYQVTAVYDKGESLPSNIAAVTYVSGINEIGTDNVIVKGENGSILVAGAEGKSVKVYTANGSLTAQFTARGTEHVNVAAGLYLVNVAGTTHKVMVK